MLHTHTVLIQHNPELNSIENIAKKERRSTWLRRVSEGQSDPANEASQPRRQVTDHVRRVLASMYGTSISYRSPISRYNPLMNSLRPQPRFVASKASTCALRIGS